MPGSSLAIKETAAFRAPCVFCGCRLVSAWRGPRSGVFTPIPPPSISICASLTRLQPCTLCCVHTSKFIPHACHPCSHAYFAALTCTHTWGVAAPSRYQHMRCVLVMDGLGRGSTICHIFIGWCSTWCTKADSHVPAPFPVPTFCSYFSSSLSPCSSFCFFSFFCSSSCPCSPSSFCSSFCFYLCSSSCPCSSFSSFPAPFFCLFPAPSFYCLFPALLFVATPRHDSFAACGKTVGTSPCTYITCPAPICAPHICPASTSCMQETFTMPEALGAILVVLTLL